MTDMGTAVCLEEVSMRFPRRRNAPLAAVEEFSLSVPEGRFVVLLGPSGCGKTTILKLVAGLINPTAGRILVKGLPVTGPSQHCGMVFQHYTLFPWLTVRENVRFGIKFQDMPKAQQRLTVSELLRLAGLNAYADLYPHALSGGMQQRVALLRTLAISPPILLMDEPFGALDTQVRTLMQEHLLRLWRADAKTVLFVTHDVEEAIYLSDEIHVLTARPARLKAVLDVQLPRPREPEMRFCSTFIALKKTLVQMIREELADSDGGA